MKDTQSLLLVLAGMALGFALGTYREHNRLLAELKGMADDRRDRSPQDTA